MAVAVVKSVKCLVERAARSPKNYFGYSAWTHHIILVEAWGRKLAKKLKADQEVVALACWLHDYASLVSKKLYPQHHQHSVRLAGEILTKLNYPLTKIKQVQACILSHRGSRHLKKGSVEAKIVADADALAHFDVVDDLFLLAYQVRGLKTDAGRRFVLNKLKRSYRKMSPLAKSLIRKKYRLIQQLFPHG